MNADVEVTHREAVELVRHHLVCLRGGAPFLSPADGALLIAWLNDGVPVHKILHSVELAAAARHRTHQRIPLALRHARRFLKPTRHHASSAPLLVADAPSTPLAGVIAAVMAAPFAPAAPQATQKCANALSALSGVDKEVMAAQAISLLATWIDDVWLMLGPKGQADWIALAQQDLADVLCLVDEARAAVLTEEYARGRLRASARGTSATHVTEASLL